MKLLALLCCAGLAWSQPFKLEKTIPLPGVEGRFDHFTFDLAGKRVFVSALGNNTVEVIDAAAATRRQSLTGMHEPQGVSYSPDFKKLYVANGKDGKLRIFDGASLKPVGEIAFGDDADNVRYDAPHKLIWVGYIDGAISPVDPVKNTRGGEIALDAHPESFQLEKSGPRIFANVPEAGEIEVLDRYKRIVLAKWPVKGAEANFPMALDESTHRLFVVCRKPAKVLVYDTENGRVVTEFPCPGDSDDVYFDAARKRLYVAGGAGFIEAFEQKSADQYASLGKVATAAGARTALYVPDWNRLFLAVPHRGNQGAEIRIYQVE